MPGLLFQIVFVPVLASLVIFLFKYRLGRNVAWVAVLSLTYTTALIIVAALATYSDQPLLQEFRLLSDPGINLGFLADGLSVPIALICNLLCLVLAIFSMKYIQYRIDTIYEGISDRRQTDYYAFFYAVFLFFPVGFMGVTFSTNLVALYFFLEVLTIALYFLMARFGYTNRVKIASMSMIWGIGSALGFLAGVLLIYSQIGTLEIASIGELAGNSITPWIISVILISMFTKLALVPLHVWMPWVHAEHPTSIAGLLAVYANIAAYIIVRTLVLPLSDDFAPFGPPIMVLALVTMVYGALLTMAQTDIKRIAACSTISQIAYSMLGIGALTTVSVEGGLFFFLSHIIGKTVFFSTCGIVVYTTHIRNVEHLGGLATKMPLTALLFISGAMILTGIPPLSTFPAEIIMFAGIFQRGDAFGLWLGILGLAAILLTMGYAFMFAKRIFFGPLPDNLNNDHISDPPLIMSVPLLFLIGISALLGLYPRLLIDSFHPVINAALGS